MNAKPVSHTEMAQLRDWVDIALPIVGDGPVVMLNLLRFRALADYSLSPELEPEKPISGAEAYGRYLVLTEPQTRSQGAEVLFRGSSGPFLIGPENERWDMALLVRWPNLKVLTTSVFDDAYQAIVGHRTAALEDSRLLPILQLGTVATSESAPG